MNPQEHVAGAEKFEVELVIILTISPFLNKQTINVLYTDGIPIFGANCVKRLRRFCDGNLDKQVEWANRMFATHGRSEMSRSATEPANGDLKDQIKLLKQQIASSSYRGG
ncbi:hypothetical protein GWI33_018267 [Rhynchophorus ferrugineus]|uniref:Uncharacterized protein n=1 Tax=Rhynchophorus ferrugineus TaxID=354439 RepID=A0A834I7M8_RHYFE|nr:hypothetical protein GWI33_018267 [Rhynchophorus ferrugineus]